MVTDVWRVQVRVIQGRGLPGRGQTATALHVVLDIGGQKIATGPSGGVGCPVWEDYTEFIVSSVSRHYARTLSSRQLLFMSFWDMDVKLSSIHSHMSFPLLL
jgi:hypothetical protein